VEREVAAPRVADDERLLPADRVEHAASISDIRRHGVRPFRRRRREAPLLVPRDVVLLCELVGELTQVVETETRPAVQQQHRRPAAGATARDRRAVVARPELDPPHRRDRVTPEPAARALARAAPDRGQLS
jgi:hypothetical protein